MQHPTNNRNVDSGGTMNLDLNGYFLINLSSNRQIQSQLNESNNDHCILIIISLIVSKIMIPNGNQHYNLLLMQPMTYGSKQNESIKEQQVSLHIILIIVFAIGYCMMPY